METQTNLEHRRLGRTGLEVSALGLGAMGIISHFHPDAASGVRVVHRALELGINCIDTAASYFDSEEILGQALAGRWDDVVLLTKTAMRRGKRCQEEIDRSFRRLGTDHIHIYQVHHVQYREELDRVLGPGGAVPLLQREKARGRVGHIGITSHHPRVLAEALETGAFDTVQLPYNPIEADTFRPIMEKARELDIGVLTMKPLAGGRLSSVEAALRFSVADPSVACTLAGCTTLDHVERDVAAVQGATPLDVAGASSRSLAEQGEDAGSRSAMEALAKEVAQLSDLFCRRCRYCEKECPASIPISDIFRCHDYLVLNQAYAREEYRKLGQHDGRCLDCGGCEKICPYNLPVRDMLDIAHGELNQRRWLELVTRVLQRTGSYDLVRGAYFKLLGAKILPRFRYLHRNDLQGKRRKRRGR